MLVLSTAEMHVLSGAEVPILKVMLSSIVFR